MNAPIPTSLGWDFQDDMLKLIFTPELPDNEQTEKRRYDYDHSWITCVSRPKCIDLYNQVNEKVRPAMANKEPKFVSVPVATINQIGIGTMQDEKLGTIAYLKLVRNISQDLKSKEQIVYVFRKGEVIVDYDNENGKYDTRELTDNEFELFLSDMKNFVDAGSNAYNHANRVVDRTYKEMISGDIRAIGAKVGATVSTPYAAQRGGARYGQTSLFDNSSMNAPADQISSLDELNIEFEPHE
jgi:hypothetical protein